jgi:Flp pilus assembly protein TadD
MRCEHCGIDNNFEWATLCRNCQQPLQQTEVAAVAAQQSQLETTIKIDDPEIEMEIKTIEECEKADVNLSDPMDFIMGSNNPSPPATESDLKDTIRPEPIENELTLYRDQDVKLSISEDTSKVTVESFKDNLIISTEHLPDEEQTQESAETQESGVVAMDAYSSANKTSAISTTGNIEMVEEQLPKTPSTEKIQIAAMANQVDEPVESSAPVEKNVDIVLRPVINEIKQARGVIYIAGKNLKMTGGIKVSPGDEIRVNDKSYEAKNQPGHSRVYYMAICGIGAAVILAILAIFTLSSKDMGQLVGTISSGAEGRPLIGQGIKIAELNKTISTNEAGFFVFNDIPAGIYTLDLRTPSGAHIQDRISVVKNQTTTIALRDRQPEENQQVVQPPTQTDIKPVEVVKNESKATGKGTLKLSLSPANASVYIDNQPVGVGSGSYKLDADSYTLTVRKSGYEDSSQKIKIDSEKSLSLKVTLSEASQAQSRIKNNSDSGYEQETAGNYQEAIRYYDMALSSNPRDINSMLGKARCARAEGMLDNATTFYMQAAKLASDKGDANLQLQALSGMIDMKPNTLTAYTSRAELLYNLGQFDKAADDFSRVVEIDTRNLGAYYKLGSCYYKSGKYPDAIRAFSAAKELNFADPKANAWLAKTYLAMGDKKNTKKSYESFKETASYSTRLEFKRDPEWQKVLTALGEKE